MGGGELGEGIRTHAARIVHGWSSAFAPRRNAASLIEAAKPNVRNIGGSMQDRSVRLLDDGTAEVDCELIAVDGVRLEGILGVGANGVVFSGTQRSLIVRLL